MQHGWIALVGEWVKLDLDVVAMVEKWVKCSIVELRWSESGLNAAWLDCDGRRVG